MFNQQSFNEFVLQSGAISVYEEPLTLKSGRESYLYVNWRTVVADAFLLSKLVDFVLDFVESNNITFDTLYGVPEGATKLGVAAQLRHAMRQESFAKGSHVVAMGRAKPKEHGAPEDKYFVGAPEGKTLVVEDTITTGKSLFAELDKLKEQNVHVTGVLVLTDRCEVRTDGTTIYDELERRGVQVYSLSKAIELVPVSLRDASPEVKQRLSDYYAEYGTENITWL